MMPLHPIDLDRTVADRQERLRAMPIPATPRNGLRVRIGHALIALGSTVSGERVEPVRPRSFSRATGAR